MAEERALGSPCWLCEMHTVPKNRRVLSTATLVLDALKEIGARESALPSQTSGSWNRNDYLCKKCFAEIEKFSKTQETLAGLRGSIRGKLKSAGKLSDSIYEEELMSREQFDRTTFIQSGRFPTPKRRSPFVKCLVGYRKGVKAYNLTPSRKRMVKSLVRRHSSAFAKASFSNLTYSTKYWALFRGRMAVEAKQLSGHSTLHSTSLESLSSLNWQQLYEELVEKAPYLTSAIGSVFEGSAAGSAGNRAVCVALAVVLFTRNRAASLVQSIASVLLYAGHTSKNVFTRLNHLGICLSYQGTQRLITQLSQNHDQVVMEWRDFLKEHVLTTEVAAPQQRIPSVTMATEEEGELEEFYHWLELSDEESDHDEVVTDMPSDDDHSILEDMPQDIDEIVVESDPEELPEEPEDMILGDPHPTIDTSTHSVALESPDSQNKEDMEDAVVDLVGFKLVGDNIDKNVRPRYHRVDAGTRSLHYFNSYAVKDRISITSNHDSECVHGSAPVHDRSVLQTSTILPSREDKCQIFNNTVTLVSRFLVKYVPFFEVFSRVVIRHIQHDRSEAMSRKSEVIPLGVQLHNEQKTSEMVEIMAELHKYVPMQSKTLSYHEDDEEIGARYEQQSLHRLLLGGDQLTCARARSAQRCRMNSECDSDALLGFIPCCEDWHAKVVLLTIIWKRLYSSSSFLEKGTLFHLRNIVHRSNVSEMPKDTFHACEDFFLTVVRAHIIAATLKTLGMDNIHDKPSLYSLPQNLESLPDHDLQSLLFSLVRDIVGKHFSLTFVTDCDDSENTRTDSGDGVFEYAKEVLSLGLMYMEFQDAIREGDGQRVLRCWKYMLLLCKASNRRNYALEGLNLLFQYYNYLSPQRAEQLLYSRFINVHGLPGRNISCDLHMEHLNRVVKTCIQHLGPNKLESAIVRSSRCSHALLLIGDNFDETSGISSHSGGHKAIDDSKDLHRILLVLTDNSVFTEASGRAHPSFHNIKCNGLLKCIDLRSLLKWMHTNFEPVSKYTSCM